jgi:hypothetical protein
MTTWAGVPPPGNAACVRGLRVAELVGADRLADRESEEYEGQPSEDRDLAVLGAPTPGARGEVS